MNAAMGGSFELVQHLARSTNRVRVLVTVDEEPQTRLALREATGIPRSTLARVLAGLRRRGLVAEDADRYETTLLGRSVATKLSGLARSIETVLRLESRLADCHPDGAAVGLADLPGCELSLATPADPEAATRRVVDVVGGGRRIGLIAPAPLPRPLLDGVAAGRRDSERVEVVVPRRAIDAPRLTGVGTATSEPSAGPLLFAHDGEVPGVLGYADATAFLAVTDDGAVQGCVVTEDATVLGWIEQTVAAYRAASEPASTGVLTPREVSRRVRLTGNPTSSRPWYDGRAIDRGEQSNVDSRTQGDRPSHGRGGIQPGGPRRD